MDQPVIYNLPPIYRGRDYSVAFGVYNDDDTPMDLTDCTVLAQVRAGADQASELVAEFTGQVVVTRSSNGKLRGSELVLTLSALQTGEIAANKGYYDVLVTSASGEKYPPWVKGQVMIATPLTEES